MRENDWSAFRLLRRMMSRTQCNCWGGELTLLRWTKFQNVAKAAWTAKIYTRTQAISQFLTLERSYTYIAGATLHASATLLKAPHTKCCERICRSTRTSKTPNENPWFLPNRSISIRRALLDVFVVSPAVRSCVLKGQPSNRICANAACHAHVHRPKTPVSPPKKSIASR